MSAFYWRDLVGVDRHNHHRPQTRDEMRVAVREMAASGMTDHTIAVATRLSIEQVRRLLGEVASTRTIPEMR